MKWSKEQISSFTQVVTGGTPATDKREYWDKGTIPWLNSGDLNQGTVTKPSNFITEEGYKNSSTKLMPPDTVLVALTGSTTGLSAILKIEACANQSVTGILPSNKHYPEFLYYFFKTQRQKIFNATWGGAQPHINQKYVKDYIVPLPPIVDQIRIATILSKAEALIEQCKESIDLIDELLKNTFLKMFGDPITNKKDWQKVPLSSLGSLDRGVSKHRPRNAPELLGGIYPLVQTSEVTNAGLYIRSYTQTYSEVGLKQSKLWKKGTMLITIAANIARTGILTFDACFPDSIVGFISDKKESNNIYVHFLFSFFQDILEKNAPQSAQKNLNLALLRSLIVPKPPLKLQNQFAAIVEKTEVLKAQFQNSLTDLENLYASLSQLAFKGELDLSAVEIDETLLVEDKKQVSTVSMPLDIQKAIEISNKINKQFEGINRITKIPSALIKQLEQWNKLEDQFKHIPKLPEALLQARNNMERIQEAINKAGTTKLPADEETGFNWAVLANRIKERYKNRHFNFEMLHSFIQKDKLVEVIPYYASEELKTNPRLNDTEDLKSFIQTAIQNIEMDEKQQRQTNPFLRLTQSFYNAEKENFTLSLHKEDFKLIKDRTARQRSGIYFSLATEV
ncbi:restriction endonuclease subunit S [Chryseobacterium daecheongense]|uniref:restriction endonuclease subunit S n=1 Tax=Chryseobacterium daecheongense TaxID=192389 RepID=UPI001FD6DFE2|nr:restriction endonuclease subunit S [Chryseobacterium daecheongense]UOU97203.1 restriction endonuclease subunit S [Chryseobacterium daecheongense]